MSEMSTSTVNRKTCVISGASGLIGSRVIRNLDNDWSICAIGRSGSSTNLPNDRLRHISLDLSQPWQTTVLPRKAEAVIHLAQAENFRDFPGRTEEVFQINTMSTLKLLNYAVQANARTFIYASSGGIYGFGEDEFREDGIIHSRGDLGFYLGTKLCSEILAENYTRLLNVIVLRFFFVYGIGQKITMLIPRLVHSVLEQKPIILHGHHGLRLNPTHVADAANAVCFALSLQESHKINVAGPEVLTLREIAEQIGVTVGQEPVFDVQPNAAPRHLVGDIGRMTNLLRTPVVRFKEGISEYVRETYGIHTT